MKYRPLWLALGAVVALTAALLVGVNIYVQSDSTQQRLRQVLADAIGLPIRIGTTSYLPWRGIVCSKIQLDPDQLPTDAAQHLRAEKLRVKLDLFTLFSRSIRIRDLQLESPVIVLTRTKDGDYALPLTKVLAESVVAPTPDAAPEVTTTSPPAPAPTTREARAPGPPPVPRAPLTVTVDASSIRDGTFLIRDEKLRTIVEFTGIQATAQKATLEQAEGTLQVASVRIRNKLEMTDLKSQFTFRDGVIQLPDLTAALAGGKLHGNFRYEPEAEGRPYESALTLEGVALEQILEQLGAPSDRARGQFNGTANLKGQFDDAESAAGGGELRLTSGAIQQAEFLQSIGKMLKIRELEEFEFKQAHTRFLIASGDVQVQELMLGSENIELRSTGTISSKGELDLDSDLLLERKITKRLPDLTKENMREVPDRPGFKALAFEVKGTLSDPETDLMERLVGERLEQQVTDAVLQFLGKKKKKPEKEKP